MKKTYLFCTNIGWFISLIPPIILLIVSICYNKSSTGLLKLYPLIIFSILAIAFIFAYFFRFITISTEEIRMHGLFTSKDSAIINERKSLIFTIIPRKRMRVTLYGNNGLPAFNWAQGDNYVPIDIDLFREKAIGGQGAVKRVLRYFEVDDEDIDELFSTDSFEEEYDAFILKKERVDKNTVVTIYFTKTI